MTENTKIAIDGPAASGKTEVGSMVAHKLGLRFFDTGLTYRAVVAIALQHGVSLNDVHGLTEIAASIELEFNLTNADGLSEAQEVQVVNLVNDDLRSETISDMASQISQYKTVREVLVELQRDLIDASPSGIVVVGRDIGTVVMRNTADVKIYLKVSSEISAQRRSQQNQQAYASVLDELNKRDKRDSERTVSPLKPALDATIVNTDDLTVAAVVEYVLNHIAAVTT